MHRTKYNGKILYTTLTAVSCLYGPAVNPETSLPAVSGGICHRTYGSTADTGSFCGYTIDYRKEFGGAYADALAYVQANAWMVDSLTAYGIDGNAGIAVVFPELLRYSAIKDCLETASLRVLYVQFGHPYANFSIGRFQMKPSFAETVEQQWMQQPEEWRSGFCLDTADTPVARKQRLQRLCTAEGQVRYLAMFIRLTASRLPELPDFTDSLGLRLLATAYNYSCTACYNELLLRSQCPRFSTDWLPGPKRSRYYNYADISLYYYNIRRKQNQTASDITILHP